MTEDQQRRWHEQAVSLTSLVIGCVVTLCSGVVFSISLAVTIVKDQARQDQELALLRDRQEFVIKKNAMQDERIERMGAEVRAAQATEMAILTAIQQQLAVHEARGGFGVQMRPLVK